MNPKRHLIKLINKNLFIISSRRHKVTSSFSATREMAFMSAALSQVKFAMKDDSIFAALPPMSQ